MSKKLRALDVKSTRTDVDVNKLELRYKKEKNDLDKIEIKMKRLQAEIEQLELKMLEQTEPGASLDAELMSATARYRLSCTGELEQINQTYETQRKKVEAWRKELIEMKLKQKTLKHKHMEVKALLIKEKERLNEKEVDDLFIIKNSPKKR